MKLYSIDSIDSAWLERYSLKRYKIVCHLKGKVVLQYGLIQLPHLPTNIALHEVASNSNRK